MVAKHNAHDSHHAPHKLTKKVSYSYLHKMSAGVSLLAVVVIIAAGVMGQASTLSIAFRSAAVIIVVGVISRIVEKILLGYEEMHGGKA